MDNTEVEACVASRLRGNRGYVSNLYGQRIVNAETGYPTEHYVGSREEYQYFKVCDSSQSNEFNESNVFYYDSPEQYVRHRFRPMKFCVHGEHPRVRERKRQMVRDNDMNLVQWELVDSKTGEDAMDMLETNKMGLVMRPRANKRIVAQWHSRKGEYLASISGNSFDTEDINN